MCSNCTSYNSARTERGNTFTNNKMSFRIYFGEEQNDDYTLFYYVRNNRGWELIYPHDISSVPEELGDAVLIAACKGVSEQLPYCEKYRDFFC